MLKKDLVNNVHEKIGDCRKADVAQAVDIVLDDIVKALQDGRRVEIRGLGSFSVRSWKERVTKNPKTGKIMSIPKRKTVHFNMSKSVKEMLIDKG